MEDKLTLEMFRNAIKKVKTKRDYYIIPLHPQAVKQGVSGGWLEKAEDGYYRIITGGK